MPTSNSYTTPTIEQRPQAEQTVVDSRISVVPPNGQLSPRLDTKIRTSGRKSAGRSPPVQR